MPLSLRRKRYQEVREPGNVVSHGNCRSSVWSRLLRAREVRHRPGRFRKVIKSLEAEYFEVPLMDAVDARDMVIRKFIHQTTSMIESLAEVLKDPKVTKGKCLTALEQSKRLTEQVNEYKSFLQVNLTELEERIRLLSLQALSLVDKAQELTTNELLKIRRRADAKARSASVRSIKGFLQVNLADLEEKLRLLGFQAMSLIDKAQQLTNPCRRLWNGCFLLNQPPAGSHRFR